MGMWEASDVPMFYFLTWVVFILQHSLLNCTFTCYVVICVVVVFHEKSSPPPPNNTDKPQNSTNTQLK